VISLNAIFVWIKPEILLLLSVVICTAGLAYINGIPVTDQLRIPVPFVNPLSIRPNVSLFMVEVNLPPLMIPGKLSLNDREPSEQNLCPRKMPDAEHRDCFRISFQALLLWMVWVLVELG
jgi:hypothetical protein